MEFETVTDRTPISFRDNAAYRCCSSGQRARPRTSWPRSAAATSCWPICGRIPSSIGACRSTCWARPGACCDIESKLSKTGWLYEAWIIAPDATRVPYVCVFEEAPEGLPIGVDISERVVFNGYFLKLMKYQAADVPRGAPVLVGRIGWEPSGTTPVRGHQHHPQWSLGVIGGDVLHFPAAGSSSFTGCSTLPSSRPSLPPNEEIDPTRSPPGRNPMARSTTRQTRIIGTLDDDPTSVDTVGRFELEFNNSEFQTCRIS